MFPEGEIKEEFTLVHSYFYRLRETKKSRTENSSSRDSISMGNPTLDKIRSQSQACFLNKT